MVHDTEFSFDALVNGYKGVYRTKQNSMICNQVTEIYLENKELDELLVTINQAI